MNVLAKAPPRSRRKKSIHKEIPAIITIEQLREMEGKPLKPDKLNITFHNPNTTKDTVDLLIKIAAQVAKVTVEKKLMELAKENSEAQ